MAFLTKSHWLCMLLCVCFLLSLLPVGVRAEQTTPVTADTSWYKEDGVFFTLEDEADFLGFLTLLSQGNTFEGKSIQLTADLSLEGVSVPFGGVFSGHLDGKNHTLAHLSLQGEKAALFDTLTGTAVLRNLIFADVSLQGTAEAAVVALTGQEGARISNCTIESGRVAAPTAAGFVCFAAGGVTLSRCQNNAAISADALAGGLIAQVSASRANPSSAVLDVCTNTGAITAQRTAGGLVGLAQHSLSLSHCLNSGAVTLSQGGGSVGGLIGSAESVILKDCTNSGEILATAALNEKVLAGGLAGKLSGQVENVCNLESGKVLNASVHSQSAAGGLFGAFMQGSVQRARNLAPVTGQAITGGLIGQASCSARNSFCFSMMENQGSVEGTACVGGIIGQLSMQEYSSGHTASKALWQAANTGKVTAQDTAGGLVGKVLLSERAALEFLLVDCYNAASVQSGHVAGGLVGIFPHVQTAASQAAICNSYQSGQVSGAVSGSLIGQLLSQGNLFASCAFVKGQPATDKGDMEGAAALSQEEMASETLVSLLNGNDGSLWRLSQDGHAYFSFVYEVLTPSANIEPGAVLKHTDPLVLTTTAGGQLLYTVTATLEGKTQVSDQKTIQSGQSVDLSSYTPGTELTIEVIGRRKGCADTQPVSLHVQLQAVQPLTITGLSLVSASREYDGTNVIALQGTPSLMGAISENDDVYLEGQAFGRFLDKDAGTGKVVSVQGISLVGADAAYYTLITPIFTADIVRRPLTLVNVSIADKGYDGTATANVSNVDLVGILEGESVSIDYLSAKAGFTSVEKGDSVPAFITNLQLQGVDSHNYSLLETNVMTTGRIVTLPGIERTNTAQTGQCTLSLDGLDAIMPSALSPGENGSVLLYAVANDIALPESAQTEQGEQTQSILAVDLQLKQAYVVNGAKQSESSLPPGMITAPLTVHITFTASDTKQTFYLAQPNAAGELVQLDTQSEINQDGTVTLTAQTQTMGPLVVRGVKVESSSGLSMSTVLPYVLLLLIIVLIVFAGRKTKGSKA